MRRMVMISGAVGAGLLGLSLAPQSLPAPQGPPYQRLPQVPYESHPNQSFLSKVPRTIGIIGGGTAGLTTAKVLSQQGFQVEVLEKGSRVGGVWADNYEGSGLQGPFPHYNFPDHTFPEGTPMLPKLDLVRAFVDAYVEKFQLGSLISVNCEVVRVSQAPEGDWSVQLKSGDSRHYDFLVLANGQFFSPHIPDFPGLATFKGKTIHSFDLRNAKELCAGKRVVVIGGGKSAYDAMNTAASNGGQVSGVMRQTLWALPLDKTLFGYPVMSFLTNRLFEVFNPAPEEANTWKSVLLKPLKALYMRMLCGKFKEGLPDILTPDVDLGHQRYNVVITRDPEVFDKIKKGEIRILKGEVERVVPEGVVVGGRTLPADVIICATGFRKDNFGLSSGEFWLYRNMLLPDVRNFAVVGYGFAIFTQLKNSLQAVWLAEVLRGTVRLPDAQTMKKQVQVRRAAAEGMYQDFPALGAYASPEVEYFRSLLRDMGLQERRKRTIFHDFVEMPNPEDYRAVVTHRI